jgi:hypothetical protein
MEVLRGEGPERHNDNHASRVRLKALQGVGQKNPDADHAKQCGNCLDHHKLSFTPRGNKTVRPAEQSKEFKEPHGVARRLMISGNRKCQEDGKPLARLAFGWQHPGGKPIQLRR